MSHLTEFSLLLAYVKRRLGGEVAASEEYRCHGRFGGEIIKLPMPGMPPLSQISDFYSSLHAEVERSCLKSERKTSYRRFISAAYLAHRAAEENQPQWGWVWHLEGCLNYIIKALWLMEASEKYDDDHPVQWAEVYPPEYLQLETSPEEYWLLFKLESLLPVLRLSVRILRSVFPDCHRTWDEWEASLYHKEWLRRFILDSKQSSRKKMLLHAPQSMEVVGHAPPGLTVGEIAARNLTNSYLSLEPDDLRVERNPSFRPFVDKESALGTSDA